jgi:hypothetical protein
LRLLPTLAVARVRAATTIASCVTRWRGWPWLGRLAEGEVPEPGCERSLTSAVLDRLGLG